jgi:single-stranded DNA-binding protein
MSKATLTIEGFVAKAPELGNHNGKSVTNVSVPHTPRRKNQQTGQYEDAGPTLWVQASFWEADAEAIVATVTKRTLVTITGQPELNVYTKQDGTTDAQLRLRFATLGVIPRQEAQGHAGRPQAPTTPDEPWSTPGGAQNAFQGGGSFGDDAPF